MKPVSKSKSGRDGRKHPPRRKLSEADENASNTAWDAQAAWYDRLVGDDGSSFHKEIVIPGTMSLLRPEKGERILDLGCGQGVFCRMLAREGVKVTGVDLSSELIRRARLYENSGIDYHVADACSLPAEFQKGSFDAAVSILAAGNMESLERFFSSASAAVKKSGRLVVVLMHPCFRIPRQSHWQYDSEKKLQYRRLDRYMTPLSIPIITHPGKKDSSYTMMFHRPLNQIFQSATGAGWMIHALEEWTSNRTSSGLKAKAENRARQEFPLFLAIRAVAG